MAVFRRMTIKSICIGVLCFLLGIYFIYELSSEDNLTKYSICPTPAPAEEPYAAVVEELYHFHHSDIRYINRTPGYRFYDDHFLSAQNNLYLEKYKLHYCKIDKNMGSSMQAFFCYIDDPGNYSNFFFNEKWGAGLAGFPCSMSTIKGDLRIRFMEGAKNMDFFNEISGISHIAIVRNPVSRFISAFVDVCVINTFEKEYPEKFKLLCFECGTNLTCFLPRIHKYLYHLAEHMPEDRWHRDWHFYPQAWYCDFDRHLSKYQLIHYKRNEEFYKELTDAFRNTGVEPNLVQDIETQLRTKNNLHETFKDSPVWEKQIWDNPLLLEYVFKIYYLDFVMFGYRL